MNQNNETIQNPRSTVVELLSKAVIEIFSEYELNFSSNSDTQEILGTGNCLIALIGLSTESIRMSLTLLVPQPLLKISFPMDVDEINDKILQDWIGELSNHLGGRLKHNLLPYGCNLILGLPTVIQGSGLQIDQPKNSVSSTHQFSTEKNELIEVGLSTLQQENFMLHTPVEKEESELEEDDQILFF